jgi:D-glycero-D-manno-heptose 1,7-bisphosphate phosphatase
MANKIGATEASRRFVMLDRDGTIIEERHYLADPDQVEIIPGVVEALHAFREMGLGLVVITNQSGLGRGLFSYDQLEQVNRRMASILEVEGISLDGIYICPHRPDAQCTCRKPLTGMALEAARDLRFVASRGFVVGDRASDINLGRNLGATTFLVRTGYGTQVEAQGQAKPDFVVDSLKDVAPIVAQTFLS